MICWAPQPAQPRVSQVHQMAQVVPVVVEIAERGLVVIAIRRPEIGAHLVASEVAHDRLGVGELLGDLLPGSCGGIWVLAPVSDEWSQVWLMS